MGISKTESKNYDNNEGNLETLKVKDTTILRLHQKSGLRTLIFKES